MLPGYVYVTLFLQVEFAVERQQQGSGLQSQVLLLIVDVHCCQQVFCHYCANTYINDVVIIII